MQPTHATAPYHAAVVTDDRAEAELLEDLAPALERIARSHFPQRPDLVTALASAGRDAAVTAYRAWPADVDVPVAWHCLRRAQWAMGLLAWKLRQAKGDGADAVTPRALPTPTLRELWRRSKVRSRLSRGAR